jgi:hypothetical protein
MAKFDLNNMKKAIILPLIAASLISTSSYAADNKVLERQNARIERSLEEKLNIPNADVKSYGNLNSDKTIYVIPQFHVSPNPNYSSGIITEEDIINCQGDIYKTIEYLHKNKKVDLLLVEGIEGEVTRDRFIKKIKETIPSITEDELRELMSAYNKIDASIGIECKYGPDIYTVGIDSQKLLDKSMECLDKRTKLEKKLLDSLTEDKAYEKYLDLDEQYNNLTKEFNGLCSERSSFSAKMTKEYLNKKRFKSGIIVYGGNHEKELVDSLKEYKVYTIELNSYKTLNEKIQN